MKEKLQNFFARLKEKWEELTPEEKKKVVVTLVIIGVILVSILGYYASRGAKKKEEVSQVSNVTEIGLQRDILERAYYAEASKQYEELRQQIEALKQEREELLKEIERVKEEAKKAPREEIISAPPTPPPPPPPPPATTTFRGNETFVVTPPPQPSVEVIGEIQRVSGEPRKVEVKGEEIDTKGVKKKYYLPPSFMEATLLSGLDAPAISKGEGHPVPCLLRIKAPAILPNKVKANLKGCFVIGEGLGNLASERADVRIVSLSCVDKKGRAVIDQRVKGFVVDTDGKIGLRGRVVSKMGSVIARAMLAGFVSGLSNVLGTSTYTWSVSPEGALVVPKTGEVLKSGIASGIKSAADQLVQFYMELARQTIPVVEVLPVRTVTVVISEGVWLELKDYETY